MLLPKDVAIPFWPKYLALPWAGNRTRLLTATAIVPSPKRHEWKLCWCPIFDIPPWDHEAIHAEAMRRHNVPS